jgi:hypothetical protein
MQIWDPEYRLPYQPTVRTYRFCRESNYWSSIGDRVDDSEQPHQLRFQFERAKVISWRETKSWSETKINDFC